MPPSPPARILVFRGRVVLALRPPPLIGVPMLTRRFWPKRMIPLQIYAFFTLLVTFGIDFCDAFLVARLSLFNLEALQLRKPVISVTIFLGVQIFEIEQLSARSLS